MTLPAQLRAIADRLEAAELPDRLRGDGPCQDCGTPDNPVWFTDNVLWNHVTGETVVAEDPRQAILCPNCFLIRADSAGLHPTGWRLLPEWPWRERTVDSASVQVADEGAGGEAERSLPPPDAPIEQVTPDGSPGSGSARRRQPTISPASPGTDFDPLGPAAALLACTECVRTFARPQGLALHAKSHRRATALTNGAPPSGNGLPVAVGVSGGGAFSAPSAGVRSATTAATRRTPGATR